MNIAGEVYRWQYKMRQWAAGCLYRLRHRTCVRSALLHDPDQVLLILTGMIGDTVMSTPVILEARRLWPGARIVVLGGHHNCELLSACPLIDTCIETSATAFSLRRRRQITRLKERLREERFEVAIIILGDQFAPLLAKAGIPIRVGVRPHVLEPYLTHTYDIGSPRTWGPVQRLGALRTLGCQVRDVRPRLWVSRQARHTASSRLAELGLPQGDAYAVVHLFGSTACQWWPAERVGQLAEGLQQQCGLRTVMIGGPETPAHLPAMAYGEVIDATGALSIQDLLGVVEGAALVISTDSGPFHIAGALRRPLVGMFRSRRPEHANRYPQAQVVFGKDSYCEKRCKWDRCRKLPCRQLGALSVADVLGAARLAQRGGVVSRRRLSQHVS